MALVAVAGSGKMPKRLAGHTVSTWCHHQWPQLVFCYKRHQRWKSRPLQRRRAREDVNRVWYHDHACRATAPCTLGRELVLANFQV
ncbi:hypothetical protein GQ607_015624 [Colletotrichum asianum]|uniref:Uncharacterized protein n=1 Tax=Colletotrichum asianum TaxID=702518 RepID=A0A8H3ZIF9_9PEZI|nr:hypothetical protein GQ607_015624 [Colletotrichum asianum]